MEKKYYLKMCLDWKKSDASDVASADMFQQSRTKGLTTNIWIWKQQKAIHVDVGCPAGQDEKSTYAKRSFRDHYNHEIRYSMCDCMRGFIPGPILLYLISTL